MKYKNVSLCVLALVGSVNLVSAQNSLPSVGNVGIGTTSPGSLLSLGPSLAPTKLALYENGNDVYGLGIAGSEFQLHLGYPGAHFSFRNEPNGPEVMTVHGNGNVALNGELNVGTKARINGNLTVGGQVGFGTFNPTATTGIYGGYSPIVLVDIDRPGWLPNQDVQMRCGDLTLVSRASGSSHLEAGNVRGANGNLGLGAMDSIFLYTQDTPTTSRINLWLSKNGDLGLGTTAPQAKLDVIGQIRSTTLLLTSDRNVKGNLQSVEPDAILQRVATLPLSTWHYTNAPSTRHLGPMAQDFKAAFPELGEDDKHIATVDADGVALASIQALYGMVQAKNSEIAELKRHTAALRSELADLRAGVTALEKSMSRSVQFARFAAGVSR